MAHNSTVNNSTNSRDNKKRVGISLTLSLLLLFWCLFNRPVAPTNLAYWPTVFLGSGIVFFLIIEFFTRNKKTRTVMTAVISALFTFLSVAHIFLKSDIVLLFIYLCSGFIITFYISVLFSDKSLQSVKTLSLSMVSSVLICVVFMIATLDYRTVLLMGALAFSVLSFSTLRPMLTRKKQSIKRSHRQTEVSLSAGSVFPTKEMIFCMALSVLSIIWLFNEYNTTVFKESLLFAFLPLFSVAGVLLSAVFFIRTSGDYSPLFTVCIMLILSLLKFVPTLDSNALFGAFTYLSLGYILTHTVLKFAAVSLKTKGSFFTMLGILIVIVVSPFANMLSLLLIYSADHTTILIVNLGIALVSVLFVLLLQKITDRADAVEIQTDSEDKIFEVYTTRFFLYTNEAMIVRAIIKGKKDTESIAKYTSIPQKKVKILLNEIYEKTQTMSCVGILRHYNNFKHTR